MLHVRRQGHDHRIAWSVDVDASRANSVLLNLLLSFSESERDGLASLNNAYLYPSIGDSRHSEKVGPANERNQAAYRDEPQTINNKLSISWYESVLPAFFIMSISISHSEDFSP